MINLDGNLGNSTLHPNKILTPNRSQVEKYGGRGLNPESIIKEIDYPDAHPFVFKGKILLFGTEIKWNGYYHKIPLMEGSDTEGFKLLGNVLVKIPEWASGECFWAPCLTYDPVQDLYILYYACKCKSTTAECWYGIGAGTSKSPYGPFVDETKEPVVFGSGIYNIDPNIYVNEQGRKIMVWGSGEAPLMECPLADNGLALDNVYKNGKPLLFPDFKQYMKLIEAPQRIKVNGWDILFFSGDNTWFNGNGGYACMFMVVDEKGIPVSPNIVNPVRSHILLEWNEYFTKVGHFEIFEYKNQWYLVALAVIREKQNARDFEQVGDLSFGENHLVRVPVIIKLEFDKFGLPIVPGGVLSPEEKNELELRYNKDFHFPQEFNPTQIQEA